MLPQRERYEVDPEDPRAPSQAVWETLTEEERAAVVADLPSEFEATEASPPEGDQHGDEVARAKETLRRVFRSRQGRGRGAYVGSDLPVYYPGEAMFAPDILVVLDVTPGPRERWAVQAEGKGLDLVLEVVWSGSRRKDLQTNVARYARLGIREYFVFDQAKLRLQGYRRSGPGGGYASLLPRQGTLASEVLGLTLGLEGERLRFYHPDGSLVADAEELQARMQATVDAALLSAEEKDREAAAQAREAEEQASLAAQRAKESEELRLLLEQARAELARLKGQGPS